ncbi:hypothetical protein SAMN05720764_11155 [Fibrobacter sp. UWH5]|uniref:hypothetical protein n=1 Tax=Fibrobacter sp. UWH5 TaxID=1896211 RepID=UPI000920E757|nr:hypothetical protein [Fibrobacter sp. UWH5]SHL29851.1 hypothetical protein SAMN05720764_11155 [Fibrobacter sp. UWH5]
MELYFANLDIMKKLGIFRLCWMFCSAEKTKEIQQRRMDNDRASKSGYLGVALVSPFVVKEKELMGC